MSQVDDMGGSNVLDKEQIAHVLLRSKTKCLTCMFIPYEQY